MKIIDEKQFNALKHLANRYPIIKEINKEFEKEKLNYTEWNTENFNDCMDKVLKKFEDKMQLKLDIKLEGKK